MIRANSFNTAIPIASALAAAGKTLAAAPGSLLSELLSKSNPTVSMLSTGVYEGMNTVESFGYVMSMLTEDGAGKPSDHSILNGNAVSQIAPAVGQHIHFAKNVVKPLVVELATRIEARSQDLKKMDPAAGVEIIMKSLPAILQDESFLDTLRHYRDRTPTEPTNYLSIGDKSKEEIIALALIGHKRTDELIVEWLSKMPEQFLRKVWHSFFNVEVDKEEIFDNSALDRMTVFDRIDYALAVYLIGRKVYEEVQDSQMSLDKYKNIAMSIRDYAGDFLVLHLKMVYSMIEGKILVIDSSLHDRTITVNGELYNDWINTGGKPEILLGMLTSNQIATSIPMIDAKAENHLRSWNTFLMFSTTENNNKFYDRLRQAVLVEFDQQLLTQDPSETEINDFTTERLIDVAKRANDYIDSLKNEDFHDFFAVALCLVAGMRFCHTSSYQILHDIGEACKANPQIDVREAALLAAINYLADSLADQIVVVN